MDIYDGSQSLRQLVPLKAHLYVEEICDLGRERQAELRDCMLISQRDSQYRLIVSSCYDFDQLSNNAQIDSRIAGMWQDAISIPALNQHIEDIPELLEYYVNWYSDFEQLPYRHFNVAAQNLLRNHYWSGDIGQLKQFVKAILSNSDAEKIELGEIEKTLASITANATGGPDNRMQITIDTDLDLREAREVFEREYLSYQLALSDNNISELARRVGQERTHLYRKLKSLGLQAKKQ
jgi:DNA-binding NtrC family response regulator